MTFNLGVYESHLEFHDHSHTHCIDDGDYFTNGQKSEDESRQNIFDDNPSVSSKLRDNIDESNEIIDTHDALKGTHTDMQHIDTGNEDSSKNDSKATKPVHQCFQGGYFLLILSNGLSNVAFKFPPIAYEAPATETADIITVR